MIDTAAFAEGMGQLGGAYGREIDGPVVKTYFGILSPAMSTEQFAAALTKVIATERFWPSPAVILEAAGVDVESRAQSAFRLVADTLNSSGGYRFMSAEKFHAFDDATKAGIKAVGGLRMITECTERRWASLVRDFCKAYTEAVTAPPALPAGDRPQARTLQLVREVSRDRALPRGDR